VDNLLQIGIVLTAIDKMSGVLTGAAEKATQGFARLQQKIKAVSATMTEMGTKATLMGHGILTALETPVKAFADLDEATTDFSVSAMNNLGQVPQIIEEINKQAIALGNKLPGTTADFTKAATALKEQGVSLETITKGGLNAASYMAVVLKQPPAYAAEMVAKLREAYGLADDELVKMTDLTQKAKFAFGLNADDIKYSAAYMGGKLNELHMTGVKNAEMLLAFQGYAQQHGIGSSQFGTNMAMFITRMTTLGQRLRKHSPEMREVAGLLHNLGVQFEVFDKKGKFLGLENLFEQMKKLKSLTDAQRSLVFNKLFGEEGERIGAAIMDMNEKGGLQKQVEKLHEQADLMQRIDAITKSVKNTWEALTGTLTNLWASVGEPMVKTMIPYINQLNDFIGGPLMDWVAQHKELVKWLGLAAGAAGVLLVALGGLGIVAGAVGTGLSVLCGLFAALTWPVTLTIAALVGGAILIIKYWDQVKAFFTGVWQGFMAGIQPVMPQLRQLWQGIKLVGRVLLDLIDTIFGLIGPIDASTSKFQSFGTVVGKVFADGVRSFVAVYNVMQYFTVLSIRIIVAIVRAVHDAYSAIVNFVGMIFNGMQSAGGKITGFVQSIIAQLRAVFGNLVHEFFAFGAAMLDMLVAGIKSKVSAVVGTVSGLTERIRGFFNHSPAKEGALRDIHQHTLSEMVASAIKPGPVVRALQAMTAAGLMALAPLTNPVVALATATPPARASHGTGLSQPALMLPALAKLSATPAMSAPAAMPALPPLSLPLPPAPKPAPRLAPSAAAQSGAAAPVTIHFAPQITVQGGSGTAKDDIMAALKKHEHELVKLIEQVMARNARRQY